MCQGVKCVEKESELGCKVYHATWKQSFPKEQSVLGSKLCVSLQCMEFCKAFQSCFSRCWEIFRYFLSPCTSVCHHSAVCTTFKRILNTER